MTARIVLFTSLLTATAAHTQAPTWHSLHFGDSRDVVRAQLNQQQIATETSQEGSLHSTADYDLFLPGLTYSVPIMSSYHFTDAGGLMDVTLTVDLAAARRLWANSLGNDENILRFLNDHLSGAIAGRYGAPIYRSPGCDAETKDTSPSCVGFWSGPQQSILVERSGSRLFIRYQMLATDL